MTGKTIHSNNTLNEDYVRANLRTFIFVSWDYLLALTLDPEKYITGELPAPS